MWTIILLLCVLLCVAIVVYKIVTYDYGYFKRRNLKYRTLAYSLKGLAKVLFGWNGLDFMAQYSDAIPGEPIFGVFDILTNKYVIRDAELVKKICITDFEYFEDHFGLLNEDVDRLFGNSLPLLKGQKWHKMRSLLSPAFTQTKVSQMFELVLECAENVTKHLKQQHEAGIKLDFEMKDLSSRYANDVILSCVFGLTVDSLAEPENQFFLDGKKLSNFGTPKTIFKLLLITLLPRVARLFNVQLLNPLGFRRMFLETMENRKKNNIFRPDMINIIIELQEANLKQQQTSRNPKDIEEGSSAVEGSDIGEPMLNQVWTEDEIVAQCFGFFLLGFDAISSMLMLAAWELITNQDIQQKLYEEIVKTNKQLGGERINYDSLRKMKYLDQFISELLRKWPQQPQSDRRCTKDYAFEYGDKKFNVEEKAVFLIPIYGIHHDPKYYPDPEKFDPERFSDENKQNIVSGSYLPFGIGPRSCIASSFALMELKVILYQLLLNFSFEINEKTDIPIKWKPAINWTTKNGMNLEFKPRSSSPRH